MILPAISQVSEDEQLIRAAAEGDRGAFGELYTRYARMVHGILLARVPPGDAEDLVQDVFTSAIQQIPGLRAGAAFRGWIAAIARNRAIDYFREIRRRAPLEEATMRHGPGPAWESFEVLGHIRGLPEAYRETLILRLVEGMTGPEIAVKTGLSPNSVRVNLCRGMKLLRERMGVEIHE